MPHPDATSLKERWEALQARIAAACERSGRRREEVVLIGASKRQPAELMGQAWELGLRIFGENRVQEAEAKRELLPAELEWHLIGPLQSNKVRRAVRLFAVIHSVDRLKIARGLDLEAGRQGKILPILVEVNLGRESGKHGFSPQEVPEQLEALADLKHLELRGLMAIPPHSATPNEARPWFQKLRRLRDELCPQPGWLSMGMSGDFEVAIEEGATHVRLGTALFGPRSAAQ